MAKTRDGSPRTGRSGWTGLCACGKSICYTSSGRSRLRENSGLYQGIALAIPFVLRNQIPLRGWASHIDSFRSLRNSCSGPGASVTMAPRMQVGHARKSASQLTGARVDASEIASVLPNNRERGRPSMKIRVACIWIVLLAGIAAAQLTQAPNPAAPAVESAKPTLTIPAGTRVPLSLKQAISTKTAKTGDPVYAETAFPFVVNDRVVIPAGTYIQGKIERAQRGGHVKGRAEVLIHFTSMIYPNGYTVMLGGSVENTPGAEKTSMKDSEGTIRQDSDAGRKAKEAAGGATTGAVIGAVTAGGKGAGIGAGAGGAAGRGGGGRGRAGGRNARAGCRHKAGAGGVDRNGDPAGSDGGCEPGFGKARGHCEIGRAHV